MEKGHSCSHSFPSCHVQCTKTTAPYPHPGPTDLSIPQFSPSFYSASYMHWVQTCPPKERIVLDTILVFIRILLGTNHPITLISKVHIFVQFIFIASIASILTFLLYYPYAAVNPFWCCNRSSWQAQSGAVVLSLINLNSVCIDKSFG